MEAVGAASSVGKMHQVLVCSVQTPALSTAHITQASPTICSNSLKPSSLAPLRTSNRHSSATCNGNGGNVNLRRRPLQVVCGGLRDFIGGDLLGFDLDKWASDVEKYGAIAVYPPAEGGYEGRYAVRLKAEGYHFMNISARGLGDPEAYLTKVHGVRPVSSPFFLQPLTFQLWLNSAPFSDECMQCWRGYKKFFESHSSNSEWIVVILEPSL